MNIGDLVRIVVPPYKRPELRRTLAIVLENQRFASRENMFRTDRVVLRCLYGSGEILTTEDKLELIAK